LDAEENFLLNLFKFVVFIIESIKPRYTNRNVLLLLINDLAECLNTSNEIYCIFLGSSSDYKFDSTQLNTTSPLASI